jgi:hypothetical protein
VSLSRTSRTRRSAWAAGALAAVVRCALASEALRPDDLLRALEARGIPYDADAAQRAAVAGILQALDPGAKLVGKADAAQAGEGRTVAKEEEWPDGICYLKLHGIYADGATDVVRRVAAWAAQGKSGLILDARGAGGSSLEATDAIAGLFAGPGSELYGIRDRGNGNVETLRAPPSPAVAGRVPLMLLTDQGTRDAAEVLAAALRGRSGVMLIGARTRGDAAWRSYLPLPGDRLLYTATASIAPAGGADYGGAGVQPDVAVSNGVPPGAAAARFDAEAGRKPLSERAQRDRELMQRVAADACLARAADILLALRALGDRRAAIAARRDQPAEDAGGKSGSEVHEPATHTEGSEGPGGK